MVLGRPERGRMCLPGPATPARSSRHPLTACRWSRRPPAPSRRRVRTLPILRRSFGRLSDDPRIQALVVAFCFGALLEALAGFGAPVAICSVISSRSASTPSARRSSPWSPTPRRGRTRGRPPARGRVRPVPRCVRRSGRRRVRITRAWRSGNGSRPCANCGSRSSPSPPRSPSPTSRTSPDRPPPSATSSPRPVPDTPPSPRSPAGSASPSPAPTPPPTRSSAPSR